MRRIAVLGPAEACAGIRERLLRAGFEVTLVDVRAEGTIGAGDPTGPQVTSDVAAAAGADLLLVTGAGGVAATAASIDAAVASSSPPSAVLLDRVDVGVTEVAQRTAHPDRVVGFHLTLLPHAPGLVEIGRGLRTSQDALAAASALAGSLELASVVTDDRPGLLLERVLLPYLNQAVQDLDDGLGRASDIDLAVRLGLGYPVGPFALMELRGLAQHAWDTAAVAGATGSRYFDRPPLLQRLVAAGAEGPGAFEALGALEEGRDDG